MVKSFKKHDKDREVEEFEEDLTQGKSSKKNEEKNKNEENTSSMHLSLKYLKVWVF